MFLCLNGWVAFILIFYVSNFLFWFKNNSNLKKKRIDKEKTKYGKKRWINGGNQVDLGIYYYYTNDDKLGIDKRVGKVQLKIPSLDE